MITEQKIRETMEMTWWRLSRAKSISGKGYSMEELMDAFAQDIAEELKREK